jgi:tripartite ATP-independent transporter DctP family solute receptor
MTSHRRKALTRIVSVATMTWAATSARAQGTSFVARFGGYLADQDPTNVAARRMAEFADKASGGRLKITVFTDGKLGNEREVAEALRTGGAELVATLGTGLAQYVPEVGVLELPFTSRNDACAVQSFLDVMPEVEKLAVPKGFRPLTAWGIGERGLLTRRPVRSLDDLKGMKMRGPAPLYLGTLKALGANPVQMPWSEIYVGLDTGSIDGMEASPQMIYPSRFQETAKYFTVTRHINPGYYLLVSERFWQRLPTDLRQILRESAENAFGELRKQASVIWNQNLERMKAAGVEVIDLKDLGRWEKSVEGFRTEYAQKLGPAAEALAQRARQSLAACK